MDAQTYHDLHCTIVRLEKVISHARYQDKRTGIIPPQAMGDVLNEIGDAVATISTLTNDECIFWRRGATTERMGLGPR